MAKKTDKKTPTLADFRQLADDVDGEVYEGYSGRGMYGKECIGVVCDNSVHCIEKAAARGIMGAVVDSMGRQQIVYWPRHNP